jgi:ubiquinone/menaquinone biosynthesis C-methylase UbiE
MKDPIDNHPPEYYNTRDYDTPARWSSYYRQITEVLEFSPKTVLEIGVGNRTVSNYLKGRGVRVTTMDIEPAVKPDVLGDVSALPFEDGSFDAILCCQVLEHVDFDSAAGALAEFRRVARKAAVISLPDAAHHLRLFLDFPKPSFIFRNGMRFMMRIPRIFAKKPKEHAAHKWSIGRRGYGRGRVEGAIRDAGFKILKSYNVFENPRHRFYVLEK